MFVVETDMFTTRYLTSCYSFLAQTFKILTVTPKRLNLALLNLVTFSFYLLGKFWKNSSKVNSPWGMLQLFVKFKIQVFCSA